MLCVCPRYYLGCRGGISVSYAPKAKPLCVSYCSRMGINQNRGVYIRVLIRWYDIPTRRKCRARSNAAFWSCLKVSQDPCSAYLLRNAYLLGLDTLRRTHTYSYTARLITHAQNRCLACFAWFTSFVGLACLTLHALLAFSMALVPWFFSHGCCPMYFTCGVLHFPFFYSVDNRILVYLFFTSFTWWVSNGSDFMSIMEVGPTGDHWRWVTLSLT